MRSDCASIPTRGSRLVGLLSMIITSVLGSGGWEQERRGSTHARRNNNRIVILTLSLSKGKDLLLAPSRNVASRIRNLSQDRPLPSTRRRGHIAGPPIDRKSTRLTS